eukprot:911052-Ditylum_brightwellii.AAC.1
MKKINTKHIKRSKKCKEDAIAMIDALQLEERTTETFKDIEQRPKEESTILMQEIDNNVDRCLKEAENKITRIPSFWWSGTLYHAHLLAKYWSAARSFERNKLEGIKELKRIRANMPPEIDVYQGNKDKTPSSQLQKAKKKRYAKAIASL